MKPIFHTIPGTWGHVRPGLLWLSQIPEAFSLSLLPRWGCSSYQSPQSEEKWQQNWLCAPHRADSGKINVYIERSDLCTWQLACLPPLRTPTMFSEHSAFHVHIRLDEESQCRTRPWLRPSMLHTNNWFTHVFVECRERLTFLTGRHLWLSKCWETFMEKRPQCFSSLPAECSELPITYRTYAQGMGISCLQRIWGEGMASFYWGGIISITPSP